MAKKVWTIFQCKSCKHQFRIDLVMPKFECTTRVKKECPECGLEHDLYFKRKPNSKGREVTCEARFKLPECHPDAVAAQAAKVVSENV